MDTYARLVTNFNTAVPTDTESSKQTLYSYITLLIMRNKGVNVEVSPLMIYLRGTLTCGMGYCPLMTTILET